MPLSKIQTEILRLLASQRDPESYVAGGAPLNREGHRFSKDIDIFHDRADRVVQAAMQDAAILEAGGFAVSWLRELPLIYTANVVRGEASTHLEWVADSDYRYFPTIQDSRRIVRLRPAPG